MVNVLEGLWADGTELLGEGGAIFPDPARAEAALAFMRGLIDARREPALDHRRRRGVDAAGLRPGRGRSSSGTGPMRSTSSSSATRRCGAGSALRPCRAIGTGRAGRARRAARTWPFTGARGIPTSRSTLVRALTSESAQRLMASGAALYPTRVALYHAPDLVRAHPALPAIAALTLAGRPRPVTPVLRHDLHARSSPSCRRRSSG